MDQIEAQTGNNLTATVWSIIMWVGMITLNMIYLHLLHSRRSYQCAGEFVVMHVVRPLDSTPFRCQSFCHLVKRKRAPYELRVSQTSRPLTTRCETSYLDP